MRHNETCFFGEVFCHARKTDDKYVEHIMSVTFNGNASEHYTTPMIKLYMSEIEWVAFKNSVLAADEKMFGRHHVTNG